LLQAGGTLSASRAGIADRLKDQKTATLLLLMKRHLIWFDVTIYLIVAALAFGLRPHTHRYWIGPALFLFGLAFWVTARLQLGR